MQRILKPREKLFQLIEQADFPAIVLLLIKGGQETPDHATLRVVSFMGSTPVAKYIYYRAISKVIASIKR